MNCYSEARFCSSGVTSDPRDPTPAEESTSPGEAEWSRIRNANAAHTISPPSLQTAIFYHFLYASVYIMFFTDYYCQHPMFAFSIPCWVCQTQQLLTGIRSTLSLARTTAPLGPRLFNPLLKLWRSSFCLVPEAALLLHSNIAKAFVKSSCPLTEASHLPCMIVSPSSNLLFQPGLWVRY